MYRAAVIAVFAASLAAVPAIVRADEGAYFEVSATDLADKIHGGLIGQLLGNLNGLPHENKYYEEPGNVAGYVPALPDGARTDDDTDIEWVYIVAMQRQRKLLLGGEEIAALWRQYINSHIWCANLYARRLMDIGIEPPLTGALPVNPWSSFNISGQFVSECFGLIAPAMPRTAAKVALNYTHVSIDGEPAQATQLFTTMIATAFVTDDIDEIIDAGVAALDPASDLVCIVADVRHWWKQHPTDWRMLRQLLRDKYMVHDSRMRNQNGYELCTGSTIAALLYGHGDLVATLTTAFNFGWDADNNAATAGTIIGVMRGYEWIAKQGWTIKDVYRNTTRAGMPTDETITKFARRLTAVAEIAIIENGGRSLNVDGKAVYRIRRQSPENVEPLTDALVSQRRLRRRLGREIAADLESRMDPRRRARAAYLALCLGMADSLQQRDSALWATAVAELRKETALLDVLYNQSPGIAGDKLRAAATAAGLPRPE